MSKSVTVVMPTHNAEKWIAQAINSVLAQTFPKFDLWVMENGSTDDTLRIAKSFTDPRVTVFELGPVGFQGALGHALENVTSEWIARMDSDDLMFPNRIEAQMSFVHDHSEFVMVGTNFALLTPFNHLYENLAFENATSRELRQITFSLAEDRPHRRFCGDPTMLFNRAVALSVGGYDPDFSLGDVPLWIRMLDNGRRGWEMVDVLHAYRMLPASISQTNNDGEAIRKKYGLPTRKIPITDYDRIESYWYRMARMELEGDFPSALRVAAEELMKAGRNTLATKCIALSLLGPLSPTVFRLTHSPKYRRRTDWEATIAEVVGKSF